MKSLRVTPLWFEASRGARELVSKVEFYGYDRPKRPKLWFSAEDITVLELCDQVRRKFKADSVDFQPPLFTLCTREYHAADYF